MNFLLQRKTSFKLASGVCTCRFGLMALHVPPRWRQDQNMYYAIQGPQSVVRVDWMDYWFWWWLFYCSSLDVFKDSSEYNMIRDSEEEDTNIARGGYRGGSFTVHLLIFFWVGFRWDGHYGPEMGGMDPTCCHPKPRPTNPRDFLTHHYFRTEMESSKSPRILIQRCFQKLCPEPFLE